MRKLLLISLLLSGCSTPLTTMQNGNSVVSCGGGTVGSLIGGLIGYHIQERNDHDCVVKYANDGYKVVTPTE